MLFLLKVVDTKGMKLCAGGSQDAGPMRRCRMPAEKIALLWNNYTALDSVFTMLNTKPHG